MASLSAALHVDGHVFPVTHCHFEVTQAPQLRGQVSAQVRYSPVQLVLDVPDGDVLLAWAADPHKRQATAIVFLDANGGRAMETLRLPAAYCVTYQEQFSSGDAAGGAYQCFLTLSDPTGWTIAPGGPATAFVAPVAREHGEPAVAASGLDNRAGEGTIGTPVAAPFVVGADGVPRLPLITGDPPFEVTGPKKGKADMDPVEFERQLKGQQKGLNELSVADFIANRDQYIALSIKNKSLNKKGGGRAPQGSVAQLRERKKALKAKVDDLRLQTPPLTKDQAEIEATKWLKTQTALHDPDQIAGGHAAHITGMGDKRVNSAIGGAWPSRIEGIDKQIRDYAKTMTPAEQATTYLNVILPIAY